MKRNIIKNNITRWATALSVLAAIAACSTDDTQDDKEWVDPRYVVEDSYTVDASGTESFTFQIRSNMEWEVYTDNPEWSAITPSSGEADLETATDVTVTYNTYNELDDRSETLYLKSDYWVFKEVSVTQIGIAKLLLNEYTIDEVDAAGTTSDISFTFVANQDWSIVTPDEWITITSTASGSISDKADQTITVSFSAEENKGEMRTGTINLCDRNGDVQQVVTFLQAGVTLAPSVDGVDTYEFRFESGDDDQYYEMLIQSNSTWFVKKDNPADTWYYFVNDSGESVDEMSGFDGDATIKLLISKKASTGVQAATFTLETEPVEGVESIVKSVLIKQNGALDTTKHTFDQDTWALYVGTEPETTADGAYFFSVVVSRMAIYAGSNDLYHGTYEFVITADSDLSAGETHLMINPGTTDGMPTLNLEVEDKTFKAGYTGNDTAWSRAATDDELNNEVSLAINIYPNEETGYLAYEYYVNGELVLDCTVSPSDATYKVSNSVATDTLGGELNCVVIGRRYTATNVTVSHWNYTPPTDWDVEPSVAE